MFIKLCTTGTQDVIICQMASYIDGREQLNYCGTARRIRENLTSITDIVIHKSSRSLSNTQLKDPQIANSALQTV